MISKDLTKKKIGCIITARSSSKRLPFKHFKKIKNLTILDFLLLRVKKVKKFDKIIIATTKDKNDKKFSKYTNESTTKIFYGHKKNVTKRVLECAKYYKLDIVCLVTGDCPLIDYRQINDLLTEFISRKKIDYINNGSHGLPNGMACQIFTVKALEKSYKLIKKKDEYEHVTLCMRRNNKIFKNLLFKTSKNLNLPNLAVTLDEKKDFILIKNIILYFLKKKNLFFSCKEMIKFLEDNKTMRLINSDVKRNDNKIKLSY